MIKYDVQDVRGDLWKKGKSLKQEGLRNQWGSPEVVKRFLINTHLHRFQNLMPIIIVFGVLGVHAMITQDPPPLYLYNLMLSVSFVIAQFIVIVSFLHYINSIFDVSFRQFRIAKRNYLPLIVSVSISALLLYYAFNFVAQKLPKPLSYDVTQAQLRLEGLFNHPIAIVFTFITVVALQPLIQN